MKRIYLGLISLALLCSNAIYSQVYTGSDASSIVPGTSMIKVDRSNTGPTYIKFEEGKELDPGDLRNWIIKTFELDNNNSFTIINSFTDQIGQTHTRYQQLIDGVPVIDGIFITHMHNNMIFSINGNIYKSLNIQNNIILSEKEALQKALSFVNAVRYKWEMPEEEALLKRQTNNPEATYYPEGKLTIIPDLANNNFDDYYFAYSFNIYSDKPLRRSDFFIDASTGKMLFENKTIKTADVQGTAVTKYSGTQTITTDSYSGEYRLRETGRGDGIETYDMNESTNYGNAVDFVDADNYWDNFNAQWDEVATDAHWGAESTYDYYWLIHGRNSIDGNGFALYSYVHYDVMFANAFWDGQRMTYGDGDGTSWTPLTALDICAHEITHGLTSFTADLIYSYESGALNEGFSDILGTSVEWFAKPTMANWLMGEDIGSPIRSLSNPNSFNDPDTYLGNYWATGPGDNGGVHTNCGVLSFWYYLLSEGGNGTNDNGDPFNVTGVGIDTAGQIAFRTLTVYLVPSSQYSDTRFYSILSATDLYGACSQPVQSVTDAFYAVGVGAAYIPGVQAEFTADLTSFCDYPATVNFTNQSNNAVSYFWDFGDGSTSSAINPSHTYNSFGTFDVKLVADGGACGIDSITKLQYIDINPGNPCIIIIPQNGIGSSNSCFGKLFDSGGTGNYQNNTDVTFTINPVGASNITLNFLSFGFENGYDYLYIYDGPTAASPLIGQYDGNTLPNGGTIISSGDAITLKQITDQGVTDTGFELDWSCNYPTSPPVCDFSVSDTLSCDGEIQFSDNSTNGPTAWNWDFGDGNFSNQKNPYHTYTVSGLYTVKLVSSNAFGSDSLIKNNIITINIPQAPLTNSAYSCGAGSVTLTASGSDSLYWYDDPVAGNLVNSGPVFITPILNQTTDYYVENVAGEPPAFGGKPNNSGGGSYYTNWSTHYLVFDCYKTAKLVSVKVYANGGDNRNIELQSSNGIVIQDTNIYIPDGESRITLNFDLPVDNNLRLVGPNAPNLYRNNNGCNYPYTVGNFLEIKHSSAGSNPTGYYYYFYDWEVMGEQCFSPRSLVTATITDYPTAGFSLVNNDPVVNFYNTSTNAKDYFWDFGDNTTSTLSNPTHTYTANGIYNVMLVVSNTCGSDTAWNTVYIYSVPGGYNISGNITYDNAAPSTPLNNVKTYLYDYKGSVIDSTTTDTNGDYLFTGIIPGNYNTIPFCSKPWGGGNSADALVIMKHFVNLQQLSGLPLMAADVDASNYVNTSDALLVAQRFVLIISSFPAGDWVFEDNPVAVLNNNVINDFKGLCYGDVNQSYIPPTVKKNPDITLIRQGSIEVESKNNFVLPVKSGSDISLNAISVVIEFPADLIDIRKVDINTDKGTFLYNVIENQIRISWYSLIPMNIQEGENIFTLSVNAKNTDLEQIEFEINPESSLGNVDGEILRNAELVIPKIIQSYNGEYFLGDNYPNPFTTITQIEYSLAEQSKVILNIHNILGEKVLTLVNKNKDKGIYKTSFDGSQFAPGLYFYKMEAKGLTQTFLSTKTMIITK